MTEKIIYICDSCYKDLCKKLEKEVPLFTTPAWFEPKCYIGDCENTSVHLIEYIPEMGTVKESVNG